MQVAGLAGTAYFVWMRSIAPRLPERDLSLIVIDAFRYSVMAWALSAALLLGLCAVVARRGALGLALRTSRVAVWFAPASLLLVDLSPAFVVPALVLVVSTTRLFYSQWQSVEPGRGVVFRRVWPALTAALALQSGAVSVSIGRPLQGAFLFVIAATLITVLMLDAGWMAARANENLPRAILGIALTIVLAAGLTTVHQFLRMGRPGSQGAQSSGDPNPMARFREMVKKMSEPDGDVDADDDDRHSATRIDTRSGENIEVTGDVFPGVILIDERPIVTLVTPRRSWLKSPVAAMALDDYSIPFSGEYWMFRPPQSRPPRGAFLRHGSPLALSFRTTDHRNLAMEAHQRLDRRVELNCCRAIRVSVSNADRYPGTVSLELVLIRRGMGMVSLGRSKLNVWPPVHPWTGWVPTVFETLEFSIPAGAAIREFDELKVVLHRDAVRQDRSAKISIERFTFVPRTI